MVFFLFSFSTNLKCFLINARRAATKDLGMRLGLMLSVSIIDIIEFKFYINQRKIG